jgi:hypothetical protein
MGKKAKGNALGQDGVKALRSAADDLKALDEMNLKQLQTRFLLLYGVETHSKNLTFLRRTLAWKLQEIREGGLSEKAKARLEELKPPELPVRASKAVKVAAQTSGEELASRVLHHEGAKHLRDGRMPSVGTVLRRNVEGREHLVVIEETGFRYEGGLYRSLSAVAKVIMGTSWNGFVFFGLGERL